MNNEKVILFPKWKQTLEEDSLLALKEKRYEEALHKLDQLLDFQVNNHEIVIGKLICLMELDRYTEAQELNEHLLANKNENYYHYVHIYLTILFQTNQYKKLMEQVEYEYEAADLPGPMREQFQQLYDMSQKLNVEIEDDKHTEYISELREAVKEQNHAKQWRSIESLRKLQARPSLATEKLLVNDHVHPVTKTAIFLWLKDSGCDEDVHIHKLDMQAEINPSQITDIQANGTYKQILLLINKIESNNPTLYQLMEVLLYRYIYVRFPIMPASDDVEKIAKALTVIGETNLGVRTKSDTKPGHIVERYQDEIKLCETLYLSIIEE
ncbi:hypothetical protein CFK37_13255 [Virgibacillus phasianinus]|uniref:Tetratricopeptide repeat-containing protein n=1 Tax=Virgibacillus phasianinus TaxID=2017483 RepID=A0A220U4X5_9BACI|nr:tetratricopeptide repeat protein [Virgibacillus phasianinus]ASK63042.1 hypothetical protein CFK37_13255 [Virgibacillus phasianinus]